MCGGRLWVKINCHIYVESILMEYSSNGGSKHVKQLEQYFMKTFDFTQVDQTLLTYKRSNIFKYR